MSVYFDIKCCQRNLYMKKIYGYARISRKEQSILRQIRNIRKDYPDALIIEEVFTGTKISRPQWDKLYKRVATGDTIVFDSVSRMSRSADEGVATYFALMDRGVELVFLKEPFINTSTYLEASRQSISSTGNDIADIYIEATNKVIKLLAEKQIVKSFEQAEKEVKDLQQRTREGIETARLNGKSIGGKAGSVYKVKKRAAAIEKIKLYSRSFQGNLSDKDCMKLIGLSRNTFYKYKNAAFTIYNQCR